MAGEIIAAHTQNLGQCNVLDGVVPWVTGTELFLQNGLGLYFLSFDPPFQLHMDGNADGTLKPDVPGGINAAFVLQFALSTDEGKMTFTMVNAGIIFIQHCVLNNTRMHTLAHIMQDQLAHSASMAALRVTKCTPASSTAPKSPVMIMDAGEVADEVGDKASDEKGQHIPILRLGAHKDCN